MMIFTHPRSGSTALLKIYKWINKTYHNKNTLDLGEFLNIGTLHDGMLNSTALLNVQQGSKNRVKALPKDLQGKELYHCWRPFWQPLVQHFVHNGEDTPKEHTHCEIDQRVFDLPFNSPDFLKHLIDMFPGVGKAIPHGDPIGHPLKEVTKTFNKDELFPAMILQQKLRMHFINLLVEHNVSYVAKVFPGYKEFFKKWAEPFYPDIPKIFGDPTVRSNDCVLISNDVKRSLLSQGILLKYSYSGNIHNYQNKREPVEPQPNIALNPNFMKSRIICYARCYDIIKNNVCNNVITKDDLFNTQSITIDNVDYDLHDYFDKVPIRQYPMPYTTDLVNYFTNGEKATAHLNDYILEHYPDIAEKYLRF